MHNIITKFKRIKDFSMKDLPDRTKIFLSALWFWAFIMYYFTKIVNCMLGFVITYTPDSCIIYHPKMIYNKNKSHNKNSKKPKILDAKLGEESITNKIKMLVDLNWDDTIECGGVNTKKLMDKYPSISTSILWIAYLFEMDEKIENMSDGEIGKSIKHMLINISDKAIYRESSLEEREDILFGEIPF